MNSFKCSASRINQSVGKAKSYLALLSEALENFQLAALASTVFVVSSSKNESLSSLGHDGWSIEVGKYFSRIVYR